MMITQASKIGRDIAVTLTNQNRLINHRTRMYDRLKNCCNINRHARALYIHELFGLNPLLNK